MSANSKGVRCNCAKYRHSGVYVTDFREGELFDPPALPPPNPRAATKRPIMKTAKD